MQYTMFFRNKKKKRKEIDIFNYKALESKAVEITMEFTKMVISFKDKTEVYQNKKIIDKEKQIVNIF